MDPNLVNATLGTPPAPANILGASNYGEISQMGAIDRKLPTSIGLAGESINIAQEQVAAQKAAEALAAKKAEDLADPKKYRKVKKDDGGYDFFDPEGKQVDIATLTQRTETKAGDWVGDSENPIDIQYLEENKNLNDYVKAKLSNDAEKVNKYETANPELKQYQGKGGIDELINAFKNRYRRYYITQQQDPQAWGNRPSDTPLVPSNGVDPNALNGPQL